MQLSAATLKKANAGDVLRDSEVHGLHVRVTTTGARYMLYYRTRDGRERRPKLGDATIMTLSQARARAREMLLAVACGQDPAGDALAAREASTVAEYAEVFWDEHAKDLKSADAMKYLLDTYVLPAWKARKLASITGTDVTKLRKKMADRPILFNRVRALVSKMFNYAEDPKRLRPRGTNPVVGVPRFPERKRRRYMSRPEALAIAAILDREEADNPASVAFIRLLILTGARKGEVAAWRWDWVTEGVVRMPDSKTGARDVFLSPAAVTILESLPRTNGTILGIKSPQKLWVRIREEAGCPDLHLHDLRHSFASVALSMGLTLGQIGELLGHASAQTTMRYAHLIDENKRVAVAQTAAAITARMLPEGIGHGTSTGGGSDNDRGVVGGGLRLPA